MSTETLNSVIEVTIAFIIAHRYYHLKSKRRRVDEARSAYESAKQHMEHLFDLGFRWSNKGFRKAFRTYREKDDAYAKALLQAF